MIEDKFADEMLTDDELDRVTGGTGEQTANDSLFLNSLNGSCKRYDAKSCSNLEHDAEIIDAWATVGIKFYPCSWIESIEPGFGDNTYYLNGQEITQEQARQHAMKVTGHYMSESEWKY